MQDEQLNRNIDANRIVVKIGTSSLIYPSGEINLRNIDQLAFVLSSLCNQGKQVILVSSGAIGVGLNQLSLTERPASIAAQQALASIGQSKLIMMFSQRFEHYGQKIGQLLLTHDVFDYPQSRQNVLNTFDELLQQRIIPVVNENDSVAVDELDHKTRFGDNDQLSAIVTSRTNSDLLIMLSDIDGFYDMNPLKNPEAALISQVSQINQETFNLAGDKGSRFGTGGMVTKLLAAERLINENRQMVLANGRDPRVIFNILDGEPVGTWFTALQRKEISSHGQS
ncbi:glutamate 5-kinase [Secundilactobacillus oryzae JCM 18671]|uniref:Glutamate 5-kinase n=1 Tax=Secundilactobacillus oryzae JCM 18671 TaxID=1291743 RepID=A0A081BHF8_9LACO|nr:glutamate 5-kinase [Secundilactobacillus oryzae]GAK47476.1 glutamate 5-kinase [Secundilactobacillus oryzae JCM 18671]